MRKPPVKVAVCQVPDIMKDTKTTLAWMEKFILEAEAETASLICFPECYLQGYITDETNARKYAINVSSPAFQSILDQFAGFEPMIVFGMIEEENNALYNTAVVIHRGKLIGKYRKTHLLDGEKLFTAGTEYPVFNIKGLKFGINICYDTQFPEAAAKLTGKYAELILCVSNTMMRYKTAIEYKELHLPMRSERVKEQKIWMLSSDVTGERDGRIAYGTTSAINPDGEITKQIPFLKTGMLIIEI